LSTYYLLSHARPVQERVDWLQKGTPNLIGCRIENGDLAKAAMALDAHAQIRGLKIKQVARFWRNNVDCAFALGEAA
jgi:hypothetical protein